MAAAGERLARAARVVWEYYEDELGPAGDIARATPRAGIAGLADDTDEQRAAKFLRVLLAVGEDAGEEWPPPCFEAAWGQAGVDEEDHVYACLAFLLGAYSLVAAPVQGADCVKGVRDRVDLVGAYIAGTADAFAGLTPAIADNLAFLGFNRARTPSTPPTPPLAEWAHLIRADPA